jgi:hypothetical protein
VCGAVRGGGENVALRTDGERWTLPVQGKISALQLSGDGRYLLAIAQAPGESTRSGYRFRWLRWRLAGDPKPDDVDIGPHMAAPGFDCLVTDDGSSIVAGGRRWNIAAGAAAAYPASNEACAKTPDTPGQAIIESITTLEKADQVARSADGRHAATLVDGSMRVWALDPGDLIAQACGRGPRALSAWEHMPANAKADACGRARDTDAEAR